MNNPNLTKTVVYIAGPFRGDVAKNVMNAEAVAALVATNGISFVCPHSNGAPHDHLGLPDQYWLDSTLEIMRRCDAVLVTPNGWQESKGTMGEIKEAYRLGKPVFFRYGLLLEWADGRC